MLSAFYKSIGMIFIVMMLVGHHSFQVHAQHSNRHQIPDSVCSVDECHHEKKLDICEKIDGEQLKVSAEYLNISDVSRSSLLHECVLESFYENNFSRVRERIPLSHKQLARSQI